MRGIKLWPHVAILALVCAAIGGAVGYYLVSRNQPAELQVASTAARVERVEGQVALRRGFGSPEANQQYLELTPNTPVKVGDRIYTRDNARAGLAFTGRNFARLDDNTSLDVLSLSHGRTQLALRDGTALFNVGELNDGELFEVATPYGAVDLQQPGLYQIGIDDRGSTIVSVLSGLAQVVGLAGSGQVSKGEMLTLLGQTAADIALSRLDSGYAGNLVDDYYGYQYPDLYDGRYRDYNAYLNDPYYYDPYNRYTSYQYVTDTIPGVYDLDGYGDWQDVDGYGYAWRPRVDASWAPYQQGYWTMDDLYGMTWVSTEQWGYAPYHYGRWAFINNQWFWVPDRVNTEPAYAPALVAFLPMTDSNLIGWAPLGPGDPYAVTYYDENLQPVYLNQQPVIQQQIVNLYAPNAVTVISAEDFSSRIDRGKIKKIDKELLARARPVLDPLSVTALRQAALQNEKARRKVDVPQDVARRLDERSVITSNAPVAPSFRKDKDLARALRAETVPEKQRKQKLEFKDNRQQTVASQPGDTRQPSSADNEARKAADQERKQKIEALSAEASRGNKEARRQVRELERQQRDAARVQQRESRQQQSAQQGVGIQSAQGERVGQPTRQQNEAGRGRDKGRGESQAQPRQQVIQQAGPKPQKGNGGGPDKPQKQGGGSPQSQKGGGGGKGKGRP
ncbi:MAG TPA: DUF6600 domain-containing protein [Pyrinomonadaceae bacterium]|nr:DUF6600 domain-containing protein [Pyrinomonadaceae bacterium]